MSHSLNILILVYCIAHSHSLITGGSLQTKGENWKFLTRFCYQTRRGRVEYVFEYPTTKCCQEVILYYDTQWPSVYPAESKSCEEKRDETDPRSAQVLALKPYYTLANSRCIYKEEGNVISCSGNRSFTSARVRWWYLVLANCQADDLEVTYRLVMTNGDSIWTKHFSADEKYVLQTDIFFLTAFFLVISLSLLVAYQLSSRQLFHTTYKLYLWQVFFELLSIIVNLVYYIDYGRNGEPKQSVKNIARACHSVSDVIFVVLLILLGKGWTVTRGRISSSGQVKLSLFCTFYTIAYIALFIYEAKEFDPGKVLYLYESPAGLGLCILRVLAWIWFTYGIFFTLKNYVEKRYFYYPFWMFYTLWFLSGPIVVLMATYMIEPYMRAQIMNMVERSVAFVAALFFLVLTRPTAANKNFPYHVRTSQIGIIDDSDSPQNFTQHAYTPTSEEEAARRNITAMFSVNNYPHVSFNGLDNINGNAKHIEKKNELGKYNFGFDKDKEGALNEHAKYNANFVGNGEMYDLLNTSSEEPSAVDKKYVHAKAVPISGTSARPTSEAVPHTTARPTSEAVPHTTARPTSVLYRSRESLTQMFRAPSSLEEESTMNSNETIAKDSSQELHKLDVAAPIGFPAPPTMLNRTLYESALEGELPPVRRPPTTLPPIKGTLFNKDSDA